MSFEVPALAEAARTRRRIVCQYPFGSAHAGMGYRARAAAVAAARFRAALIKALPGVPGEEILWRFHFMLGAMSYAISGTDALHMVAEDALDDADAEALGLGLALALALALTGA